MTTHNGHKRANQEGIIQTDLDDVAAATSRENATHDYGRAGRGDLDESPPPCEPCPEIQKFFMRGDN